MAEKKEQYYSVIITTVTGKQRNAAAYFGLPHKIKKLVDARKYLKICLKSEFARDGKTHKAMKFHIEKTTIKTEVF